MPLSIAKKIVRNWLGDLHKRRVYHHFDEQKRQVERLRFGEQKRRVERLASQALAIVALLCGLFYVGWCISRANWSLWYIFVPFLLAELAFLVLFVLWVSILWNKRHHRPAGLTPKGDYSVDVFIPTCGEPLKLIKRTVTAALALDYPRKTVHVLDDGDDDRLRALADEFGANYIRRPRHDHAKAGNLNHALAQTSADLILALDADQVTRPELIRHIIGYFDLPYVGFVQTPQSFELPENDPWGNSDNVFHGVMQSAKDFDNSAISCGSGVMYRRAALKQIGGFSTWNLVEDVQTSMKFHENGWKSIFHDVAYTKGHAPSDVISHETQRWQWAVDSMRLFFWNNPLRHHGLSWPQRLQYFHFGYNYLVFALFLPIFFSCRSGRCLPTSLCLPPRYGLTSRRGCPI